MFQCSQCSSLTRDAHEDIQESVREAVLAQTLREGSLEKKIKDGKIELGGKLRLSCEVKP